MDPISDSILPNVGNPGLDSSPDEEPQPLGDVSGSLADSILPVGPITPPPAESILPVRPITPLQADSILPVASILPGQQGPDPVAPVDMTEFGDVAKIRQNIYNRALAAAQNLEPIKNANHTLRLVGVDYNDSGKYTKAQQKAAILSKKSLGRRIRGTWELVDNATGDVVDKKQSTLMTVPHMTERGTFINKGTEYTLSNQQRLLPGVYTRVRNNGEIESHANILPGKGQSHRYFLEPGKGRFRIRVGQGTVGMMPLLRLMGATNKQLQDAWGHKLFAANKAYDDPAEYKKLRSKFLSTKEREEPVDKQDELLRKKFADMEVDPEVMQATLGSPHKAMTLDALLDVTKKLVNVSEGTEPPDDRDALPFQQFLGPEDLFAERVARDKGGVRRNLLWKMSGKGSLSGMPSSALQRQLMSALMSSGLGQSVEEINAAELYDKLTAVSRLGEGGIPSSESVPKEARNVQPSMFGFIDPLRTPESGKVGVNTYLARGARKGSDGKLYAQFRDVRSGEMIQRTPQQLAQMTVAFPGAMKQSGDHVIAMQKGKMQYVHKKEIDAELPHMEEAFNQLSNIIPMKSQVKGQRLVMASRMTSQALPIEGAQAPWVQSAVAGSDGKQSYEELYASSMGALKAPQPGTVISADDKSIKVRYDDGTEEDHELYDYFPTNRKTLFHQDAVVKPGDRFDADQLLAKSNFTDDNGTTALGRNARTAYVAWEGKNFEDAVVVSQSFADAMKSRHMYQYNMEIDDKTIAGKKQFIQAFPAKFSRAQLDNFGDNGVIKVGTEVTHGDPLILGVAEKALAHNKVHRPGQKGHTDASVLWDHHDPGVVTDVVVSKGGPHVVVKSSSASKVGDKLCFDRETDVLTRAGWKAADALTKDDTLATLNPRTKELEWHKPTDIHLMDHTGDMYSMESRHVNFFVTPDHEHWVAKGLDGKFEKVKAKDFYEAKGLWRFQTDYPRDGQDVTYSAVYSRKTTSSEVPGPCWTEGDGDQLEPISHKKVDFNGKVYCVTVKNHLIYVRRKNRQHWTGNSGRYGDKGIIADIIPDARMPQDKDGKPYEVLVNPLGIVTRTNPAQMVELALGKIAEKTGKPIKVPDFDTEKDMAAWARQQLALHGFSDLEDVIDPSRDRKVKQVATGSRFFMKLHHSAEGKGQSRGGGGYTAEGQPGKGGADGSKRVGLLDTNALLAHGATATLNDALNVRGQQNEDDWMRFMQGHNIKSQHVPFTYKKFVNQLRSAGVNVVNNGPQTNIMAMTTADVENLAADRELQSAEGVNWDGDMKEIPGGLFDKRLTGGHGGKKWSYIQLREPMPNPVMEEPIRKILQITGPQFEKILSGEEALGKYGTGPSAIQKALSNMDVDSELTRARQDIASGRKTLRDKAVRRMGYLKSAKQLGINLGDYMLTKVPVLPPAYRPVTMMGNNMPLIDDANYLYKELFEANKVMGDIQDNLGAEASGDERLATYKAFKAVTGLGDPIGQKSQEKKVKGVLKHVFGDSPKHGMVQRKLLSTTVDNVGRAVIAPNPDLDMDSVGLPEDKAFKAYDKFVTRRLVRRGMSMRKAREAIRDRTDVAREALVEEMDHRPVYISRAPVLHKFGIMAMKPRLTKGQTMQVSPLIVKGFGADFDGDAMNYHVPSTEDAREEALTRMLPSKNLFSMSNLKSVMHAPTNEYVGGLYHATTSKSGRKVRIFESMADAKRAYMNGQLDVGDPVRILGGK